MHRLLRRQLRKHGLERQECRPHDWNLLLDEVNSAYKTFDAARELLERSLEISTQELLTANQDIQVPADSHPQRRDRSRVEFSRYHAAAQPGGAAADPGLQ